MPLNPAEIVGGGAIAEGVGLAIGDVVIPKLQDFKNSRWRAYPHMPLDAKDVALLIARSIPDIADKYTEALNTGVNNARLDALTQLAREYPDLALALELWRRNEASDADVRGWLHRHGYSNEIATQLMTLKAARLSPQQIALGIMRSILDDHGLLAVSHDTTGGVVPAYRVSRINPLTEAEDYGIDAERLRIMVGEIGLPMSPQQAANAYFRDIIRLPDFYRAIMEGDTRPEWADAILAQAREYPTARDFVQLRLRGWTDDPGMYAGTARHGMSQANTDVLFKISGRPISFHQVFIGERRGGTYGGGTGDLTPAFLKSLQESNIRPEWYNLAWAQRHSYPSAFVIRSLAQSGDITPEQTHTILNDIGWPDWLITAVVAKWTGGATAATDPLVKSQQTNVITRIRNAYIGQRADAGQAHGWLTAMGIAGNVADGMIGVWNVGREVPGAGLSRSQVKKAFQNLPTEWPRDRALAELEDLGMEPDEAQTFLDE